MKSLKILLIEDELAVAYDLQENLENAGHQITVIARNLQSALLSLRTDPPDLALVDIRLEHSAVDGIDIAQRLQAEHIMPIIYLTSHSEPPTIARAQQTRPAAYLLKPFRQKELAIQVELAYYNYQATQVNSIDPFLSESLYLPAHLGKGYIKIMKDKVLYIQADRMYIEIFIHKTPEKQVFSMNLGYIAQFFTTPNFYSLSRSLLVNLNFVERIEKGQFYMTDLKIPILYPDTSYQAFLQQFAIVKTPSKRTST